MIRSFFEKMIVRLKDPSRSFKERVFILLTLVTDIVAVLALVGDIAFGENIVEIIALVITIITVPLITVISVRQNWVNVAVYLIVIGLVFVLLPILFYFGGGVQGGGVLWIIFAYLYTGLVLSGKWKPVMLVILTIEACGFYLHGYFHPEYVKQHSTALFYIDSLMSIIIVGIVCCLMVWFEEWLFYEENRRSREETRKLEEMNKSQSRFFSSMSHEIRTPINSILGLNEIILRQEDASEEIIRDANNIQGAGRMLLSLVNDILDISKIEAGKMDIVPVNYSVAALISEIVNMIWLRAEQKGLELKIEIDPSIPSELFGDEVRIKQILINLLNNAVKYTKEGSVALHIDKEDSKADQVLLSFSVTDTGMGIKQDAIPYLFDAFQRVDEEKNANIEGTGLGLSIVKQLVELMDGKITVNSVYTQGSTFVVALWQKVTRKDAVGDINISNYFSTKKSGGYVAGFTAPDARILIVDDNEMNLEVEKKLLSGTEVVVDTVTNGTAALAMTLNNNYDVILMDHLMPEMDGIECLQHIRKQKGGLNNHVPVIALTANAGSENRELYNNSGFDGYLVKPVSGKQLEEMLIASLPGTKVIRTEGTDMERLQMNTARGYSRRVPVMVTTSSMCDVSQNVLKEYQIDTIPFSIHADGKTYYDCLEASSDEIVRYMKEGRKLTSEPPTVTEFEDFFGEELKKAHQIIHITIATSVSEEYNRARDAARAYGNVRVYNSGLNSSAMGMLVLLANRMAAQGKTTETILAELDRIKGRIHCGHIADDIELLLRKNVFGTGLSNFMRTLGMHPVMGLSNDKFRIYSVCMGELENCYERYVGIAIPRTVRPDPELIFVTYVDNTVEELEKIKECILKRFAFKNVIFQKACAVMSLNGGSGALGLQYIESGENLYNMGAILAADNNRTAENEEAPEDEILTDEQEGSGNMDGSSEPVTEPEWYEGIEGLEKEAGIINSGSEDAFRTVLKIFFESIDEKADEISGYYKAEDWENYTIKVHALKSSARLVGAMTLGEDAQRMEDAAGSRDIEYIRDHHDKLMSDFIYFREPLGRLFEEEPEQETVTGDKVNEQFDMYLLESVYEALREAAATRDGSMIEEVFREIGEYDVPAEDKEILDRLRACFDDNDFAGITAVLDANNR